MISATEALLLPSARLSQEERDAADTLEGQIETHVHLHMQRRGCDFQTGETRTNVIAEVNQRLKAGKWVAQWQALSEQSRFGPGAKHVGFLLSLAPTDEAYREAGQVVEGSRE